MVYWQHNNIVIVFCLIERLTIDMTFLIVLGQYPRALIALVFRLLILMTKFVIITFLGYKGVYINFGSGATVCGLFCLGLL